MQRLPCRLEPTLGYVGQEQRQEMLLLPWYMGSCWPVVLLSLSAEVALHSSRKALSVYLTYSFVGRRMVDRYNFLWIGRIYGRSRI